MARIKLSRGLTRGGIFFLIAALIVAIGATPAFAPYIGENVVGSEAIIDGAIGNADVAATESGHLIVPAAAMPPVDSSTTYGGSFRRIYATGSGTADFVARVYLPDNAKIQALTYDVYDDSAYDSTAYLSRSGGAPGSAEIMATAASSGSSAVGRTFTDSAIAYPTVDNDSRQYLVSIELRGEAGSDLSAGRVTIEYTDTAP